MLKKINAFVIKHSLWIIIGSIVLTLGIGFFMKNLSIDSDMKNWVSPESEIGKLPHYIDKRFSGTSPILVVIKNDDVFSYESLSTIRTISRKAKEFEGVDTVMSITEAKDMRSDEYGIEVTDFYGEEIPTDEAKLASIKKSILSKTFYKGKIVSKNSQAAMILIKIKAGEKGDVLAQKVKELVDETINKETTQAYVGGNPAIISDLSENVVRDLKYLVPGVILVLISILFLSFRTARGVALPLITVLMATGMVLGLMGILGSTFTMLGAIMPVILIAVSSAYALHYLNRYYEESSKRGLNEDAIITNTSKDISIPIIMSGLTTFFGFLSLAVSDVTIVRSFGIYISIGVVLAFVLTLLFIPALLHRLKIQRIHKHITNDEDHEPAKAGKFALFITKGVTKYKWAIISFYVVIAIVSAFFIKDVRPEMDYLQYFKPGSDTAKIADILNKDFGGFSPFAIYLKGEMQDADVQKLMVIVEEDIKSRADLGSAGGIHTMISELNYLMTGVRTIPETTAEVENLWFFINDDQDNISSMVTPEKNEAIMTFMLPSVSTEFETKFYTPLQEFIKPYQKSFKMIAVSPTNIHITELVSKMLNNSYKDVLTNTGDAQKIVVLSSDIAQHLIALKPVFPNKRVYEYLISDECEIEFTDKGRARRLANSISVLQDFKPDVINKKLSVLLPQSDDYDDDDVLSLSESIAMINADSYRFLLVNQAVSMVREELGDSVELSSIEYAVGPYLWSHFPVGSDYKGDVVRTVDIENLEVTGNSFLYYNIKKRLTRGQIMSIFLAILAVLILNSFTFKEFKVGLISLIAIVFTLLVNFGIMGLFNIPLDVVTAIIASIAVGTGIDYSIHFITRYKIELKKFDGDQDRAIGITLSTVGKGILFNAFSVGLGFSVLMFANIVLMRTLGQMLAISMLVSSTSALILLPLVLQKVKIKY